MKRIVRTQNIGPFSKWYKLTNSQDSASNIEAVLSQHGITYIGSVELDNSKLSSSDIEALSAQGYDQLVAGVDANDNIRLYHTAHGVLYIIDPEDIEYELT